MLEKIKTKKIKYWIFGNLDEKLFLSIIMMLDILHELVEKDKEKEEKDKEDKSISQELFTRTSGWRGHFPFCNDQVMFHHKCTKHMIVLVGSLIEHLCS